jgi:DnaK suppressor protein
VQAYKKFSINKSAKINEHFVVFDLQNGDIAGNQRTPAAFDRRNFTSNHQYSTTMAAKKIAKKPVKPLAKKAPAKAVKKAVTAKKAPAKPIKKAAPAKKAPAKPIKKVAPAKKAPAKPIKKAAPVKKAPVKPIKKVAPAKKVPAKVVVPAAKVKTVAAKAAPAKEEPIATPAKKLVKKVFAKVIKKPVVVEPPQIIVEPITDPKFLAFAVKQKQRLLDLRDDIVDAMTGSAREAIRSSPEGSEASGSGMHQGDAGSDAYDRDFALSVLANDQEALFEIEEALLRIKKGTYGLCEMSGKRIPLARLEAIPFARLTVECQAQWEKEYGKRKFRPSGSVGFSGGGIFDEDEDSDTILLDDDED